MTFNVFIKAEAHEDAVTAFLYYEEKQYGLGEKFLNSLHNKYSDISLHPYNYSFIDEDPLKVLRDVRLRSFPYVIVFEIVNMDVIVYAVHHFKRNPFQKLHSKGKYYYN